MIGIDTQEDLDEAILYLNKNKRINGIKCSIKRKITIC